MKKCKMCGSSGGRLRNHWFPLKTIFVVFLLMQFVRPVLADSFAKAMNTEQTKTITGVVNDNSGQPIPDRTLAGSKNSNFLYNN